MVEIYYYLGAKLHFSNNLVSAYDILTAFSVPDPAREFYKIQNHPLSSDLFRIPKRVRWQSEDGEMKERIFLNGQQIVICLDYLQQRHLIKNDQTMSFLRWYQSIVDRGIEIWMIDRQEEKIQDQLILLAGYGKIKLQQEVTVLTRSGTQEKTRRYDIVEFINSSNIVKIRELKSHKITQQYIETTLNTKGYVELAKKRWHNKKIELIFSSLDGIDEQAELMIDTIPDVSYEDVREFALRLYINALENTPRDGWTFFKYNVVSKFSQILPDRKLLRAAEQEVLKKPEAETMLTDSEYPLSDDPSSQKFPQVAEQELLAEAKSETPETDSGYPTQEDPSMWEFYMGVSGLIAIKKI